jgi:hypothetical protein
MAILADGLRFPHARVFLPRTKLAYVHLRNLLTDAKRDRAARVHGYVQIWLPEELVLLFMQSGDLVNATRTINGRDWEPLPIAEAISRVPTEPELGAICFHEAEDEQLACMYASQCTEQQAWPDELAPHDPSALFPFLMSSMFDGTVEIMAEGLVNYLVFRDGSVQRAYLADEAAGPVVERVARLFVADARHAAPTVRRWSVPPPLPVQAAPALIQAYRDLVCGVVSKLVEHGGESAPAVAEHARAELSKSRPALAFFTTNGRASRDPVADTATLTGDIATWMSEVLWTVMGHDAPPPETMLKDLTRERRHMFQSAGLYDRLPWRIEW